MKKRTNYKKKLYLFDLDGVLVDSKKNMEKSWNMVNKKFNYNIKFSRYFSRIGIPFEEIVMSLGIKKSISQIKILYKKTSIKYEKLVKLYPNVKSTLRKLVNQGNKIGIITSKEKSRCLRLTKKFNLKFTTIQCPKKNLKGKPHPASMLKVLKATKFLPENTFYVGDTETDYIFAKRSGVKFIFTKYGYGKLKKKTHKSINKFSDLI